MGKSNFEKLKVFQLADQLADLVWTIVERWSTFPQKTVGVQLVCAADSIGSNIAEGAGRGTFKENRRFVYIARGSLYETKIWLRRAYKRNLLTEVDVNKLKPLLDELPLLVNGYLKSIRRACSE